MPTEDSTPSFRGRIVSSDHDVTTTDVSGSHTVMYPKDAQDVAAGLAICRKARRPVIVRSGYHSLSRNKIPGNGAVVINLRRLCDIEISDCRVTVGPAVSVDKLADRLIEAQLFLPIQENLLQSVVSSVLSDEQGCLSRSVGPLRDFLDVIHILRADGTAVKAQEGSEHFEALIAHTDTTSVITGLEFIAKTHEQSQGFWLTQLAFPFTKQVFRHLVSSTFGRRSAIDDDVDVVIKAVTTVLGHPIITVTIAGDEDSNQEKVLKYIKRRIGKVERRTLGLPDDGPELPHVTAYGKDIVKAISDSGDLGGFSNGLVSSKHKREIVRREFSTFAINYARVVSYALSTRPSGEIYFPNVSLSTRLVLREDGTVNVSAMFFAPEDMSPREVKLSRRLNDLLPEVIPRPVEVVVDIDDDPLESFEAPEGNDDPDWRIGGSGGVEVPLVSVDTSSLIPGFGGPIYTQEDGDDYVEKSHQYATSSYPAEDMTPCMVAYPEDVDDIQAAIAYAKENEKNIVARSGGHQYSGLSSGGSSTIVLSMDNFNSLQVVGGRATVGVGARLTDIAAMFKKEGVTIPHGECPLVCIGGHAQTGGYGHLLRSFGLALDYVHSFEIITGDGKVESVYRPAEPVNDGIFWAVLGGGPSSFGVLTRITFNAIRDVDHPFSRGHASVRFFQKDAFRATMNVVRDFSIAIENDDNELPDGRSLPDDLDLMCTAISTDFPVRFGIWHGLLLVEMVHGNTAGDTADGKACSEYSKELIEDVKDRIKDETSFYNPTITQWEGSKPLSFMSDAFVRRTGTTPDGREFKYPYEKRLNGTNYALTEGFVEGFVNLVDETINDENVRLVFQMGLGGAAYKGSDRRADTSCSRRDATFQVVYDVFYTCGHKQRAVELQEKMKDLLEREFAEKDELRLFWGSYGNTEISEVWDKYIDNEELYEQLQKVKRDVDQDDVFHTRFTIPVGHCE